MTNPILKLINKFITPYQLNILGSIVGAGLNILGTNKASNQIAASAAADRKQQQKSLDEQKRQYDIGQENIRPYQEAGVRGLAEYEGMLEADTLPKWGGFSAADMEADPGYQFRLEEGYRGLDRMSARAGERFSGRRAIGLMAYGQRMGSQEFGAARSRSFQDYQTQRGEGIFRLGEYAALAASGQQAAGSASRLGANYASAVTGINRSIGQTYAAEGQARAAGTMGGINAITSGIAAYNYNGGFGATLGGSGVDFSDSGMAMSQNQMLGEQDAGLY